MKLERKTVGFEVKDVDEEEGTFTGYAATFSKTPDSYGDVIEPGAFKKTLKEMKKRIKILWHHDPWEPIGIPIELLEDEKGLFVKGKLSLGVQRAREILELMKDGVVTEMSIGYMTIKDSWDNDIRHLKEIKLFDVSPVTFAANPEATIIGAKAAELKPFANEHACRLHDPKDFEEDSFRRMTRKHDGKKYSVIMAKLEGEDELTDQAFRYDKEVWGEEDAKTHCGDHGGSFEPAVAEDGKDQKAGRVLSASNMSKLKDAITALQALLEAAEEEEEPDKSTPAELEPEEAAQLEAVVAELAAGNEGFDMKEAEARIGAILERLQDKE